MYNWQFKDWGNFSYNESVIDPYLTDILLNLGEINGLSSNLPFDIQQETLMNIMISEAQKTSEIEGEFFSREDIFSSLKKHMGFSENQLIIKDKKAQNIAKLTLDVRKNFAEPLSEDLVKKWHFILMENSSYVQAGEYRTSDEQMQIVSGKWGNETVHFIAPPSHQVPIEMKNFINWYQNFKTSPKDVKQILIKTSIAHLYFESIHPFEDGNGRIGRAIIEKCMFECFQNPLFISISTAIENNKKAYYTHLKKASKTLEITEWIVFFVELFLSAQNHAKSTIQLVLNKSSFLDKHALNLNERQLKVVLKMFDLGWRNFEGGMSAKKYMSITKTSKATATRDLQDMVAKGVLQMNGSGRSIRYFLAVE